MAAMKMLKPLSVLDISADSTGRSDTPCLRSSTDIPLVCFGSVGERRMSVSLKRLFIQQMIEM
jgi:hypothetical protein